MPAEAEAVYLDASVLLAYVSGEEGRAEVVGQVLTAAAEGKLQLRTSTISIAEVAVGVWDVAAAAPTREAEAAIDLLWHPESVIGLIDASSAVMRRARDMIRKAKVLGYGLRSADAIHLASAVTLPDTTRIFVYERKAPRWAELAGLEAGEPFVVEPPLPLE